MLVPAFLDSSLACASPNVTVSIPPINPRSFGFFTNFHINVEETEIYAPFNSVPQEHMHWRDNEAGFLEATRRAGLFRNFAIQPFNRILDKLPACSYSRCFSPNTVGTDVNIIDPCILQIGGFTWAGIWNRDRLGRGFGFAGAEPGKRVADPRSHLGPIRLR